MTNLIKRKLKFVNKTLNKEVREIIQLNYLSWPDHGAPEQSDYQIIKSLIAFINEHHPGQNKEMQANSKIVFHCSAGIGRTGTIIAIYNIIESLRILIENGGDSSTPRISIFSVVRRLREQRYCMVQSVSQYEFIYEYILDHLSSEGMVTLKFPRNTFGLDDIEQEREDSGS